MSSVVARRSALRRHRLTVDCLEPRLVPAVSITRALDLPDDATADASGSQALAVGVEHNLEAGGLAGFPTGPNADFVLLSTGDATKAYAPRPKSYPHTGRDFGAKGAKDDLQHLQVTVQIPVGTTHIKFDLDFMTDETPGSTTFDDAFSVLATPVGGGAPEILSQLKVSTAPFLSTAPVNAIYANHTGVYTVDYRVPGGATSVVLDFNIADRPAVAGTDRGDGTGDTAVALDNFRFATTKQTIWLDFEGSTTTDFPVQGGTTTFPAFQPADIRSATPRATLINDILTNVAAKFSDFDIDFVLTQPASGSYGTITIGGTGANTVALGLTADPRLINDLGANTTLAAAVGDYFGFAQRDYGNTSASSQGYVASGNFGTSGLYSFDTASDLQQRFEVSIAHEVAHTLGTPHVDDGFDTNIMAEFAPRDPAAIFDDVSETTPTPQADGRTAINVHQYLAGVLGGSTGSTFSNSAALTQLKLIMNVRLPADLYDIVFGVSSGLPDTEFGGSDHAVEWFNFSQLLQGNNQIELPNFGTNTRLTFRAATVPGGAPVVYSGIPNGGTMTYAEGFVPLYDPFSLLLNTSLPVCVGPLGSLSPLPGGLPVSLSPFSTTGLNAIDPKTGCDVYDNKGNHLLIKLTSKTGMAAYESVFGALNRIELQGTTDKDKLSIKILSKSTFDPFVDIGKISGPALGALSAKGANLTGAGLNIGGPVAKIDLHDVLNGADIRTGGSFSTKTALTVHNVTDGTDIVVDGQLKLTAGRIGIGTVRAAMLSKLTVKGDKEPSPFTLQGDFKSDVTIVPGRALTAKEAKLPLLGTVAISGRTVGAHFVVPGDAGSFKTGTFEDSSILLGFNPTTPADPFAGGTFTGDFQLASFNAIGYTGLSFPTFINSNLIAAQIGGVSLLSVDETNGGTAFGIAAKNGLAKNLDSVKVKTPDFSYDPKAALPQFIQDFFVKVI